jgi:hypothetical protein
MTESSSEAHSGAIRSSLPIPEQLQRGDLRFLKMPPRSKGGSQNDKGWNTTAWYYWDSEQLEFYLIEELFNYGVYPAPDSHIVIIDIDDPVAFQKTGLSRFVADTFTVITGSGTESNPKCHYYLETPELLVGKFVLDDPTTGVHIGEAYAQDPEKARGYVVGPGSIHPNGKPYRVMHDVPIATRSLREFFQYFERKAPESKPREKKSAVDNRTLTDRLGLSIEDVCHPRDQHPSGDEIVGGHPLHGSDTGTNIHINPRKNSWHCHRCGSGGDPLLWLAVESGIIQCSDAKPGALSDKNVMRALTEWMRKHGYDLPELKQWEKHPVIEHDDESGLPQIVGAMRLQLGTKLEPDNFISEFMTYWSTRTDAYLEFFHMGAVTLLSVAVDRHIVIPLSFGDVYTNTWTFGVGLSSVARKSTALGKCKIMAEATFPMSRSLPGMFSTEGFIEKLSEAPKAYLVKDECGQVLQSINKKQYLADLRDVLAELFECTTVHRTLRTSQRKKAKTDFIVRDPYITFAWATTPDNFEQSVSVLDITSGYLVRFLYYYPRYPKVTKPISMSTGLMADGLSVLGCRYEIIIRAIERFDSITFSISNVAFDAYNIWYISKQEELIDKPTMENTIFSRLSTYVFKLAALYYVGSREFLDTSNEKYRECNPDNADRLPGDESRRFICTIEIPDRYFFAALRDVRDYFLPVAVDLLDGIDATKSENIQKQITKFLKTEGGRVTRGQLLKKLKIKAKDFNEHLDTLLEAEVVRVDAVKDKKTKKVTNFITLLQEG